MTTDSAVPESVHKATTHPMFSQCLLKWILLVCVHFLSGLCQIICSDQQMSSVFLSRQDSSHENACLNRGNASRRSWERSIMGYSDMLWLNGTTSKGYRKTTHWLKKKHFSLSHSPLTALHRIHVVYRIYKQMIFNNVSTVLFKKEWHHSLWKPNLLSYWRCLQSILKIMCYSIQIWINIYESVL